MAGQPEAAPQLATRTPCGTGHYSAEAIARRRELFELIRRARDTIAKLE